MSALGPSTNLRDTKSSVSVLHPGIPFTSVIAAGCNITHTAFTQEHLSSPCALIIGAKVRWVQNKAMIFQDTRGTVLCSGFTSTLRLEGSVWDLQKLAEATATAECVLACDLGKSCGLVQVSSEEIYIQENKNKSTWTQIWMSHIQTSKIIESTVSALNVNRHLQ